MDCPSMIHKNVCVQAQVTVTPDVDVGQIETFCVGPPQIEEACEDDCTCMVSQMLCVRFPLAFSAKASAKPIGIVCDPPDIQKCSTAPSACMDTPKKHISQKDTSLLPLLCLFALFCITYDLFK